MCCRGEREFHGDLEVREGEQKVTRVDIIHVFSFLLFAWYNAWVMGEAR